MAENLSGLVVDDSTVVRKVITRALKLSGASISEIFEACNGLEALDVLEDHPIDVMFTDLHMPEMTGIELLDELDARGIANDFGIVIVSSDSTTARKQAALSGGACAFVHKPFQPEQIREVLEKAAAASQ